MLLSIIIPSYLEGDNLKEVLPQLIEAVQSFAEPFEILVIDTENPMDHTPEVCADLKPVRYINRRGGNTYGDAVRSGLHEAQGEWVLFMDGDGSHSPSSIIDLWEERDQQDIIIGSRYVQGGATENSWLLIVLSRIVNIIYATVLGIPCKDVSNSFKLYRGEMLKSLVLKCQNFDIVEELLYKVYLEHPKLRIKEVPFQFAQRKHGETKRNLWVFVLTYAQTLIRLRWMKVQYYWNKRGSV
jgi:dolichol-phosphate mannosyltransferase